MLCIQRRFSATWYDRQLVVDDSKAVTVFRLFGSVDTPLAREKLSKQAAALINSACTSFNLENLSLCHDITFGYGKAVMLTNNISIFDLYYEKRLPLAYTDDTGRILENGIYLSNVLNEQNAGYEQLYNVLSRKTQIKNMIHFIEREDDKQHSYSFCSCLETADFLHFIINNLNKLQTFLKYYKESSEAIIAEANNAKYKLTFPVSGYWSQKENELLLANKIVINFELNKHLVNFVHKDFGTAILFSLQQSKCIKLLFEGKCTKEIAKQLNLSHRTVEKYLEIIKTKLGCQTLLQVISQYSSQLIADSIKMI